MVPFSPSCSSFLSFVFCDVIKHHRLPSVSDCQKPPLLLVSVNSYFKNRFIDAALVNNENIVKRSTNALRICSAYLIWHTQFKGVQQGDHKKNYNIFTASPLCVGFESDIIVQLFIASLSYSCNRVLSVQLHGKQLASAP